jgi:hypothetical protein
MPTEYGYYGNIGGNARYLNGFQRRAFIKKKRNEKDVGHELEHTEKKVQPDHANMMTKGGQEAAVPTVSPVLNDVSIDGVSREGARLLGMTNANPVSFSMKKSGVSAVILKQY